MLLEETYSRDMVMSDLYHVGVNHILPWQQPVLYFLQRQEGVQVKLGEAFLEQSVDQRGIFFCHRAQTLYPCHLERQKEFLKTVPLTQ